MKNAKKIKKEIVNDGISKKKIMSGSPLGISHKLRYAIPSNFHF